MASIYIGIVDGTGPYNKDEYTASMRQSFCSQLHNAYPDKDSGYLRGPSSDGLIINERALLVAVAAKASGATRLFLAGYSRGASVAVIAANLLHKKSIHVEGLFLFDPVSRHFSERSDVIPANVGKAWIARRKIDDPRMNKYDYTLISPAAAIVPYGALISAISSGGHNPVRNWFGTTATKLESSTTKLTAKTFLGSHGALGGVGWTHVTEDPVCQAQVANFMNHALKAHGLKACLSGGIPNSKPPW